jgi:hypothetical protein
MGMSDTGEIPLSEPHHLAVEYLYAMYLTKVSTQFWSISLPGPQPISDARLNLPLRIRLSSLSRPQTKSSPPLQKILPGLARLP